MAPQASLEAGEVHDLSTSFLKDSLSRLAENRDLVDRLSTPLVQLVEVESIAARDLIDGTLMARCPLIASTDL